MPLGIIPADAGSTDVIEWIFICDWDHPRGCGEHRFSQPVGRLRRGSSPRMRGARVESTHSAPILGIIPADAGSTDTLVGSCMWGTDHPRGCGEHT